MSKVTLCFRIAPELKAVIERVAAEEDRTVSNLIERLLAKRFTPKRKD